jgi:hypothetical protein
VNKGHLRTLQCRAFLPDAKRTLFRYIIIKPLRVRFLKNQEHRTAILMPRWIFLLSLSFILAGCATAPVIPTRNATPKISGDRTLTYTLSGGITGKTDTWTIHSDGRIEKDNSVIYQASPAEISALFAQIVLDDFIKQSKVTPEPACPDCRTATLKYQVGNQTYEISQVLEKTDPANPARMWVDTIDALLAKVPGK